MPVAPTNSADRRPAVILGAAAVGSSNDPQAKYTTTRAAQHLLGTFRAYGNTIVDTARGYSPSAPGSSEELLGTTDFSSWALLDTKVTSFTPGAHAADKIAASIEGSLAALNVSSVHTMYLHAPDRETPFAETLEAMNAAHAAGKFTDFGLSNYTPAEVEEIVALCTEKGWVRPSVYQGQYNALVRGGEDTLFPVLRKHGIRFYAYSPGAAGIFSGKVSADSKDVAGSRWDKNTGLGKIYGGLYLKPEVIEAANKVAAAATKAGISGHAVALRWVLHHSLIDEKLDDGVIIGGSSIEQIEANLKICDEGPLPEELVKVIEDVWTQAKDVAPQPWF